MTVQNRGGRPKIGRTISAEIPNPLVDLLDDIAERMRNLNAGRERTIRSTTDLPTAPSRWKRSNLVQRILAAGAGQFAHYVLRDIAAVQRGDRCPLCHGYVDGPHVSDCGYFGPLAELDDQYDNRLRLALTRAGRRSWFMDLNGSVAEMWVISDLNRDVIAEAARTRRVTDTPA